MNPPGWHQPRPRVCPCADCQRVTRVIPGLSGGAGSWAAVHRWVDAHGPEGVTCLFTNVKGADGNPYTGEDEDTYRFLREGAADLGVPLIELQDGRDIWDVFFEKGWLGNSRLSHCSWELKTIPTRRWLDANCDPEDTVVLIGMDWTETHRHAAVHRNYAHNMEGCADPKLCSSLWNEDGRLIGPGCKNVLEVPWRVVMPMKDKPFLAKPQVIDLIRKRGLTPPRMYAMGFGHANCLLCVKAGQAHQGRVLEIFPEHYAYAERREQEFRDSKPSRANASILTETVGKKKRPLTLREFRERKEAGTLDRFELEHDWGGCGCATESKPSEPGDAA